MKVLSTTPLLRKLMNAVVPLALLRRECLATVNQAKAEFLALRIFLLFSIYKSMFLPQLYCFLGLLYFFLYELLQGEAE